MVFSRLHPAYDGSVIQFQKRAKQILSPGSPSVLTELNETFNSVTFAEPIIALEKYGDNNVQRADAQSFVTLAHYKKILAANGKLTPAMDAVIDKAIAEEPLSRGERALLRPYKPFYYGKVNLNGGPRVSVQIKNSVVPLVPQFLKKHPQLNAMHEWMKANQVDQVQPR